MKQLEKRRMRSLMYLHMEQAERGTGYKKPLKVSQVLMAIAGMIAVYAAFFIMVFNI